jgi:uncharacterized protein (TIGR03086 family)
MDTLTELHIRAVQLTVEAVRPLSPDQLSEPTPCADWDLAALLDHMTAQNLGFAAAATGNREDETVWATGSNRQNAVADYLASASTVIDAFASSDIEQRSFFLPELSREQDFVGSQAVAMHAIDSLIHAWDVARAAGRNITPDSDLVDMTLEVVEQIPDSEDRRAPGAHFGPRAETPASGSKFDHVLALLGRSPSWPAT